MYVNGIEVFSETVDTFLPISNINGIDKATLGAVNREGKVIILQEEVLMKSVYLIKQLVIRKFQLFPCQIHFS